MTFQDLDNEKIIHIALYENDNLNSESVELLKKEILSRKLNPKLIDVIDELSKGIRIEDFFEYSKFILNLPCPICGQHKKELDITRMGQVVSFIIFTGYDKILICGCKDCLRKKIKRTMILSLIIGWWGFPMGPIKTIQSLIFNLRKIKETRNTDQSEDFLKFTYANKGFIMLNLDNEKELIELINGINAH